MKTYLIPVTYTATVVVEHTVEAKSRQEAMFALGQKLNEGPDPFSCVQDAQTGDVETAVKPGAAQIVDTDDTEVSEARTA